MDQHARLIAFVDAFNVDDLDQVMDFFAEDAEYVTLEGRRRVGKAAIRAELEAQFAGRYGRLRFLREQLIVDADGQAAAVSWRCEHHLAQGATPLRRLGGLLARATGRAPWWEGVDLFRFRDGQLVGKYTYGKTLLPRFHRGD